MTLAAIPVIVAEAAFSVFEESMKGLNVRLFPDYSKQSDSVSHNYAGGREIEFP